MNSKSSPRRRAANKRYDEDYEYYAPIRQYSKTPKAEPPAEETEASETQELKRKRGRPPGPKNKSAEPEAKRGPGRPRRYTAPVAPQEEEESNENKPIEVNILSIQPEEPTSDQAAESDTAEVSIEVSSKEKVNLGQVLELAVQSMSVTMEPEEEEDANAKIDEKTITVEVTAAAPPAECAEDTAGPVDAAPLPVSDMPTPMPPSPVPISSVAEVMPAPEPTTVSTTVPEPAVSPAAAIIPQQQEAIEQEKITFLPTEDDSDFEWKMENEEDPAIHSPPAKKKKTTGSANVIVPTSADDLEEIEEDVEGRIQVRTIVVGEGEGARIECMSCHRIMKPGSLKAHLKTHAHERPHACDLCDARFTRRGDLERHIKVVHNKDRPFKCSKCHRTFGDKKNLRWHLSNHDRKLFHHCQVCGFKFGKREYWENHVRYIHPIPGTDLEPMPADGRVVEAKTDEATPKKVDPVLINKMLNGKGSPALVYTNKRGAANHRLSADPFAGLKTPKIVFPPTYWDQWEEYLKRTMVLRFRPSIQRYGSSGRPLRRKKVPETTVEWHPAERPDSQFDIDTLPEDQALLDEQTGAFITSTGELVGYPEEMCKSDEPQEEEEEEEEEEMEEPVRINMGDIQLDQQLGGEVHQLVYGEDGQMRIVVGPARVDGDHDLVEGGVYDEDEDGMLRGELSHAFVESGGQFVILQPDGSAVLAPAGGQLVETENGQLILVQTLEDGTQTAVAYATAQAVDDPEAVEGVDDVGEMKTEAASNQDAVQTLIDAVQELIDNRQKPS